MYQIMDNGAAIMVYLSILLLLSGIINKQAQYVCPLLMNAETSGKDHCMHCMFSTNECDNLWYESMSVCSLLMNETTSGMDHSLYVLC